MQYDRYIQTLYSLLCLFCREANHGPLTTHFFYYFRLKYPFSNYYKRKPVVERVAGRISPIPFLSTSNFSIANEHPMPGFVGSFHRIISLITISVITNSSLVTMWVKGQFKTKIYFCYCRLCVYVSFFFVVEIFVVFCFLLVFFRSLWDYDCKHWMFTSHQGCTLLFIEFPFLFVFIWLAS